VIRATRTIVLTSSQAVVSRKNFTESEQAHRIESGVSWAEPARR
jgi:hypothetical protein